MQAQVPQRARRSAPRRSGANGTEGLVLYGLAALLAIICALGSLASTHVLLVLVGLLAITGLFALMWMRPTSIIWLVVVGYAVQPDLKFFVSSYFGPAKDVVAVCAIAVLVAWVASPRRRREIRCDPWIVGGVLAVLALYVLDVAGHHDGVWLSAVRPVIEAFGLFLVGYVVLREPSAWRTCVYAVLAMGVLESVTGILDQVVGGAFLADKLGFPYNEVVVQVGPVLRSFGTQIDPFNYADMVALSIPFALFCVRGRLLAPAVVLLLVIGTAVAFIRTSAGILLAVVALWLVRTGRAVGAATLIAVAMLAVGTYVVSKSSHAPGGSTATTLNGRTAEWQRVLHPEVMLAGAGVGVYGSGADRQLQGAIVQIQKQGANDQSPSNTNAAATSIDSTYLALISDIGLPGLLIVLAVFGRIVALAVRASRAEAVVGPVLLGMVLVVAIDGVTRSSLTQFPFGDIALLAIGVATAACEQYIRHGAPTRRDQPLSVAA